MCKETGAANRQVFHTPMPAMPEQLALDRDSRLWDLSQELKDALLTQDPQKLEMVPIPYTSIPPRQKLRGHAGDLDQGWALKRPPSDQTEGMSTPTCP